VTGIKNKIFIKNQLTLVSNLRSMISMIAYGNLHIWSLKNAGKFKDYLNKNKQTFDVAHRYNGCSGVPRYATMIVAARHITLQPL
jgi:hypothetical protein